MEIIIILLFSLLIVCFFIIRNMLIKIEKYEDLYEQQADFLEGLLFNIITTSDKLNELDKEGLFKSDDDIGWFFDSIKGLREELLTYANPKNDSKKTKEKEK